jgi:hypothetical protein
VLDRNRRLLVEIQMVRRLHARSGSIPKNMTQANIHASPPVQTPSEQPDSDMVIAAATAG